MSRHMSAEHTKQRVAAAPAAEVAPTLGELGPPPAKRPAKPLPNLIPIQATPLGQVQARAVVPAADGAPAPANGDDAHSTDTTKKKNSFFDQLRLYPGSAPGDGSELVCVHCGHEAKCLSELTRHNKLHQGSSRALGTSTRCQHCRHRCKTSSDLAQHLKACAKATAAAAMEQDQPPAAPAEREREGSADGSSSSSASGKLTCADADLGMESDIAAATEANNAAAHVAVPGNDEDDDAYILAAPLHDDAVPKADASLVGVETAPGYGSVLDRADFEAKAAKENVPTPPVAPKKVFKCPHCSFWAATASRFHVHMVGHANKKPFACSVCMYRSNWRWDITKHIRIKEARDNNHSDAKTLMTDDSGRRNYAKYFKHYLWLNVAEQFIDTLTSLLSTNNRQSVNGSQVNPTSSETVPILPAPPKLTRAPAPRTVSIPTSSPGALLRPPPPLQAAAQHSSTQVMILPAGARIGQQPLEQPGQTMAQQQPQQSLKRPADTPVPQVGSDPKKSNPEIKKTVWRCKQCHFRDGDRAVVLAHVKGHYRQQQEAFALAKLKNSQAGGTQASNINPQKKIEPPQTIIRKVPYQCEVCPYVSISETTFQAHVNCHKERSDVLFKCFYCPFYVSTKEEVIQHMTVHKTNSKADGSVGVSGKVATPQLSTNKETVVNKIQIKKEAGVPEQEPTFSSNEVQSPSQPLKPLSLDFTNMTEAPVCWVYRDNKLQKMLRCRYCPHVNLRKANMQEHEKMHLKRLSLGGATTEDPGQQYSPHQCPDCSYVCNNAGVLSTHTKVHSPFYPRSYSFYDPYRNDILQMKEIMEKYSLKPKLEEAPPKSSPPKEPVDMVNENKLCGINVMKLLDPNQSLTDAVLAMKKKFNLELDGEPFAEPVEDSAESPPCSPLKPLNDGSEPIASDGLEEKQLHFCNLCPARFLFRKELGIHSRFHNLYLVHKCDHCTYTARQRPHLQAHFKVHTADYQDRTTALMNMYKVHKEFPMPRIVSGIPGNLWVVGTTPEYEEPVAPVPRFTCQKCPAAFFNNEAYQAHLALHGSNNPHKCRICDYAVKSYGDLIKHMMSHGCRRTVAKKILQGQMEVPASLCGDSGTSQVTNPVEPPMIVHKEETQTSDDIVSGNVDIACPSIKMDIDEREDFPVEGDNNEGADCQEKSDGEVKDKENSPSKSPSSTTSTDASGSPDFVYPTFCRNGRVKVKKYKCKKCPSAFEKHDQFVVHMSLHGSKQRFSCPKCDYSVNILANHNQHLRRHTINDEAKEASKNDPESSPSGESKELVPEDTENMPSPPPTSPTRSAKTTGGKGEKLSVADKQAIMVLQQRRAKRAAISRESLDKNYWCSHCPYSSPRRDQVESHMRRHVCVSGVRSAIVCDHCDYSVPSKHFLRDHSKLHFDVSKAPRPDAYMICNGLELFTSSGFLGKNKSKGKIMIFQDKGSNVTSDRFLPPLPAELNDDSNDGSNKVYINPNTFESESFSENGTNIDNSDTAEADNYDRNEREMDVKRIDKSIDDSGKEKDSAEPPSAAMSFPEASSQSSGPVVESYVM